MRGVTEWVRKALAQLGEDAPDADIKAYIRARASQLPQRQVGLALRKLRGRTISATKPPSQGGHRKR